MATEIKSVLGASSFGRISKKGKSELDGLRGAPLEDLEEYVEESE